MKKFLWKTIGSGKINIVLFSGWGFNSKIWFFVIKKLSMFYKFYLFDFPGTNINNELKNVSIYEITKFLKYYIPKKSILIGWSIGGLIVTHFSILYPKNILAIISISSSPYFIKTKEWPGIKKEKIYHFYFDLKNNYYNTINNFLSLHTIGNKKYLDNIIKLKKIFLSEKKPSIYILKMGLNILYNTDLRFQKIPSNISFLRIYGKLDNLVPYQISKILDKKWPNSESIIIEKAGHIPFVSHKEKFHKIITQFIKKLNI